MPFCTRKQPGTMFIKFEAYIPLLISLTGTDKKIKGTSWQYVYIKQKHKKVKMNKRAYTCNDLSWAS
jgi:hypothetical protein